MTLVAQYSTELCFFVNGEQVILHSGDFRPDTTLLEFLRSRGLTGTKLGCGQGGCGACTVVVAGLDPHVPADASGDIGVEYRTLNACITPVCSVSLCHVITIEGLGDHKRPHVLQQAFAHGHASQCGFCTPGFVMAAYGVLRSSGWSQKAADIEASFDGNLCRCTGYRPILDAVKSFAPDFDDATRHLTSTEERPASEVPLTDDCKLVTTNTHSKRSVSHTADIEASRIRDAKVLAFPQLLRHRAPQPVHFRHPQSKCEWYTPTSLYQLLELKAVLPANVRLYNGNTDFSSLLCRQFPPPAFIATQHIEDMRHVAVDRDALRLGTSLPLSQLVAQAEKKTLSGNAHAVVDSIKRFSNTQVRNSAGLGSLLVKSQLVPILLAAEACVEVVALEDPRGRRHVEYEQWKKEHQGLPGAGNPLTTAATVGRIHHTPLGGPSLDLVREWIGLDTFIHRMLNQQQGSGARRYVAVQVKIPTTSDRVYTQGYQQSARRDGSFPLVNAAFSVALSLATPPVITSARVTVARMPTLTLRCTATEQYLCGKSFTLGTIESAMPTFISDMPLDPKATPGGKVLYRKALACSFLKTFWHDTARRLGLVEAQGSTPLGVPRGITSGSQQYEIRARGQIHSMQPTEHALKAATTERGPVGLPLPHNTALEQVCGEAQYVDDIPSPAGCLYAATVRSTHAHAKITGVDFQAALGIPGVHGYYDYRDFADRVGEKKVSHDNAYKVLTSGFVTTIGHTIGIVVADTMEIAEHAASLVAVTYSPLPPVFTIQDAIQGGEYYPYDHKIEQGDPEGTLFAAGDRVVTGTMTVGGQEHFYLEPHAILVVPGEGDEITVLSCTQCVHKTQRTVAGCLGIPANKVVVKVKRIGGAFGGKEVLSTFAAARLAIAATRLRRPIRTVIDRAEDMETSGARHPFWGQWTASYDADGLITAYDASLYANGGHTVSVTKEVMDRAISHAHNCYHIPNFRVKGICCRTNWFSFTAFRGFGAPQALVMVETMLEQVAARLGKPVEEVRRINMLKSGVRTPFGQMVPTSHLQPMWEEIWATADFERRRSEVDSFNKAAVDRKRGLSILPTMYGVNFPVPFLNQAGALVLVYQDGSVLVSHGGTEMGQGLNVKMIQVAAQALRAPVEKVTIRECASDKVPNPSPTAASVGSDINGMAVLDACEKIAGRLQPFWDQMGEGATWEAVVNTAYMERTSLFSEGYYRTPMCGRYDWKLDTDDNGSRGPMYAYFTFGVAVAEVEVDVRTGEWSTRRVDLIMDVGNSLNPAIDIGQVEGAFMQGLGMYTMEELWWADSTVEWAPKGSLLHNGPHTYKIPSASDVPVDFRVKLLPLAPNPNAVHSSKAVGEPPLNLSGSVFFALKDAIRSARRDPTAFFHANSPLTVETIRMSIGDTVCEQVEVANGKWEPPTLA